MFAWPREKHKGKESNLVIAGKVLQMFMFTIGVLGIAAYVYRNQDDADFTTRGQLYIIVISGAITLPQPPNEPARAESLDESKTRASVGQAERSPTMTVEAEARIET
ncbi:hypothetical protein EVAR_34606_1 [Eumeta japonica]|uniref:Uncharacterized protein n=1 Tax=Eumeta variegata TaxID=151549 RepID=A0A4C1VGI4_EUMVA|nr:hypothetical protein EVAR_34606_1 [Eumeta japonica]